ncbi:MAG TPA: tetratricopeptide repeat protein, partial [Polyangia bacterium]|nr:tetratricopeptide repeat protein [Polyangia bacterium]
RGGSPGAAGARRAVTRRRGRAPAGAAPFFDYFRGALARLPAGLLRVGAPAEASDIARAETALGRRLPAEYAAFLRSFDGADLFHETVLIAGVGPHAPLSLLELSETGRQASDTPLIFATGAADERYGVRDDGKVVRQDAGSDEQAVAGGGFAAWLDATVAAHQVLYGPDGEYAPDVFDPSGQDVTPLIALRQAERALKQDPGAAGWAHAEGLALNRLGRARAAVEAFERAASLDPDNPWVWFDLGRAGLEAGQAARAAEAFEKAAALEPGPGGAMLLAWAARARSDQGAAGQVAKDAGRALAQAALRRDPGLVAALVRAIDSAAAEEDEGARAEAAALLAAIDPSAMPPVRVRLRVVDATEPALPKPPPDRPPRPSRAGPRRSGARRSGQ